MVPEGENRLPTDSRCQKGKGQDQPQAANLELQIHSGLAQRHFIKVVISHHKGLNRSLLIAMLLCSSAVQRWWLILKLNPKVAFGSISKFMLSQNISANQFNVLLVWTNATLFAFSFFCTHAVIVWHTLRSDTSFSNTPRVTPFLSPVSVILTFKW